MRIAVGTVVLTPVRGADLTDLGRLLPADLELDPSVPPDASLPRPEARARAFRETVRRAWRAWTPSAWALPLAVRSDGALVGVQWLESVDWPGRREVDSSSWLVGSARGRGIGTAARRGVLTLAFGTLDARAAVTSAWSDNGASLAVSRRLGYLETHTTPHTHDQRSGTLLHLRLAREAWLASPWSSGVEVRVESGELGALLLR